MAVVLLSLPLVAGSPREDRLVGIGQSAPRGIDQGAAVWPLGSRLGSERTPNGLFDLTRFSADQEIEVELPGRLLFVACVEAYVEPADYQTRREG
jgi:hypothetical protein